MPSEPSPSLREPSADWPAHDAAQLESGLRMSFRGRLAWLELAHRRVRFLAQRRRWADGDGRVHEPSSDYRA